jgi:formate dehydrogenase alpha subunit
LRINPRDAARYGLQNGAWVRLSNAHGELTIPVKVLERVPQGQAWFPDHFGTEAMRLFHCAINPVTRTPSIRTTSVSVIKVA